ncbi:MAG: hypothetical protein HC814_02580 [Rhodobacteraceae bacterium]|nr:hypothetical protein [Paracoccaceae bacterium]
MDYRSLSSLALRLAGVFILVSGVAAIPDTLVNLLVLAERYTVAPLLWQVVVQTIVAASPSMLIGLLLIFFPSAVANRIVNGEAVGPDGSVGYGQLQTLAFSVLGLYFIAVGLFEGVYWLARTRIYYVMVQEAAETFPRVPAIAPEEFSGLVMAVTYLVGGFALLFGARGISRLVQKIRGVGDVDR